MESDELAELTRNMGTDSWMESRITAGWYGRLEGLNKKEKGDIENSVIIAQEGWVSWD